MADNKNTWQLLRKHQDKISTLHLKDLFFQDANRFQRFSMEAANLFLDYSKQRILPETLALLCRLVEDVDLKAKRDSMFNGEIINFTEQRAVLHTALRDLSDKPIFVKGENVKPLILDTLQRVEKCVNAVREGRWLGYDKRPIQAIVNLGVGGSDLGPVMANSALTPYTLRALDYYFVSNIDGTHIAETLRHLDPATTLFIVASKTFTTQETLCNAKTAKNWLIKKADNAGEAIKRHFIAVTASPKRAQDFGIISENIYPFWDWVGGRYSLWSAIGLSLAIAIGMENFKEFLSGANAMDQHFQSQPYDKNMPVIMALLGIWNINFLQAATHAIIPYDQYLHLLPAYLQQLEMESNGKSVRADGSLVDYATAPVLWGGVGTNGQHAFHQLLMQGTRLVPVDFIAAAESHNNIAEHHLLLLANCLAQSRALMLGKNREDVLAELIASGISEKDARRLSLHKVISGNVPSNTILLPKLTPHTLGALLALYEHKVFVQGVVWDINSFDQWGVELGKELAKKIAPKLEREDNDIGDLDSSTFGLLKRYHRLREK